MVPVAVVLVFKDTRPPGNSSYMHVAPHHGLPLEPHELGRLGVASRDTARFSDNVAIGIRVKVRARARVRVGARVKGGGRGGARTVPAQGCSRRWCIVRNSQAATWSNLCRDTLRTQPTTRRNLLERRCQAQLVPTNHGRMCTLTNENVIPMRCITTEAVNTNNVLILIFIFLNHGFLKDRCNIGRQTHVRWKGIGMVIYLLHEFRLRARAAKVQIGQQPFQICYGALPIHPQTSTCLPEQAFNFTLHTTSPYPQLEGPHMGREAREQGWVPPIHAPAHGQGGT